MDGEFGTRPRALGQAVDHEMHVVLRLRARRHAPAVRPADLRRHAVPRDRIAAEQHAAIDGRLLRGRAGTGCRNQRDGQQD